MKAITAMHEITRRRFFEDGLVAAAAAATVANSAPFARAAEPDRTSANDVLQHAILGCRIRGKAHAAEFGKIPGVSIAYVCDPDLQLAEELAATMTTRRSIPSRSPHRIIGTPWPRFGGCRLAKTCMSRSR